MSHILIERQGQVGYITLDRPTALNSLTHDMIRDIHAGIRTHEADDQVDVLVIRSSSDRAFCAGGDMKATRLLAIDQQWGELQAFFAEEYALNLHIAQCTKPYVSLIDGIAMGGGLGLSAHGDYSIVSETARLAMPETAIGFFPDVGGTYFLTRLPNHAGLWLALTGISVKGCEAVEVGLATHCVPVDRWPNLSKALEEGGRHALSDTLDALAMETQTNAFTNTMENRKVWFTANDQSALRQTLAAASNKYDDAAMLLARLDAMSPFAMDLTRRLLHEAKNHDLETCLQLELKASVEAVRHPDFIEGIRAVLVDKDKAIWI